MNSICWRILLPLPLLVAMPLNEVKAQVNNIGIGVGVGTGFPGFGPGFGPGWNRGYWGPGWGWGPGWYPGVFPGQMYGNYSNGMSMYGPPVPTHRPVPGMFGGGDSMFFPPPRDYRPGFFNYAEIPIHKPATLPTTISDPQISVAPTLEVLRKIAPLEMEVHLPTKDAKLYIDGDATTSTGGIRLFKSPPLDALEQYTYEVKAEWDSPEGKVTHTKKVTGRSGERVKVEFQP